MIKPVINRTSERGQVLLAVILIAVVALTIGLSLVSRSITSVRVASQSEESQRAFQAAEAGVERTAVAVRLSPTPPQTLSGSFENSADYSTRVTVVGGRRDFVLNGAGPLEQDIGSDLWLSTYSTFASPMTDNITLYFASPLQSQCSGNGDRITPAIEILVLSSPVASPTLTKHVVDPCIGTGRLPGAVNASSGGTIQNESFLYSYTFSVTNGLIARVVPIYNQTKVAVVSANINFPTQGSVIESTGTSGDSARKVVVYQSHPQVPIELFQYAILSQ